uniref:phosphoinositide 5-phosphatase n=1 Tax=Arcella intermedia TaxID=1963864 RepID=A0A6B2KXI8_9EUKA
MTIESESYLVFVTGKEMVAQVEGEEIYKITRLRFLSFLRGISSGNNMPTNPKNNEQKVPYANVERLLTSGMFYFSRRYHLTQSLQRQSEIEDLRTKPLWKAADVRFFWNYYLSRHFIKKRFNTWVTPIIRGYVGQERLITVERVNTPIDHLTLISRISWLKAGTRYNARGLNDDGNVANFVETEQIVSFGGNTFSFVQVRGSVPVFWQQRLIKGKYRVELTRTPDATLPAYNKHFQSLLQTYNQVFIVNLLSDKSDEQKITDPYYELFSKNPKDVSYIHWDFKKECGNSNFQNISFLIGDQKIKDALKKFGFFRKDKNSVLQKQMGTFRVNCLDCLDRTNVILGAIAESSFKLQMESAGFKEFKYTDVSRLGQGFKIQWANNGDHLSEAYTGTGAMKSSYTRSGKRTIVGMVDDAAKSALRVYINNFKDSERQEEIDIFLGNIETTITEEFLSAEDSWVAKQLEFKRSEYSEIHSHSIFIGSWNTNGNVPKDSHFDVDNWLSPTKRDFDHNSISIYIFGFQEIVPLSANSIVKAEEANMEFWSNKLISSINSKRKTKVVLANKIQLVGLAILVFVQENYLGFLRNFLIEKKKTAVQGFAGNKGALCCRFDFKDTAICCVCAHLSAGQNEIAERIKDIRDILDNSRFPNVIKNSTIFDHDYIFWFGDLNFRVDLPYRETMCRIQFQDFETLLENDQLIKLQSSRSTQVLEGFKEGKITFYPTYKYDIGSEVYDSTKLQRAPAWCDRVLYHSQEGLNIKQLVYARAELYHSDHRPVLSLFELDVEIVDQKKKEALEKRLHKASTLPNNPLDMDKPWEEDSTQKSLSVASQPKNELILPDPEKPKPTNNKMQEHLLNYNKTLEVLQLKLQQSANQRDTIKALANLIAQTLSNIIDFLKNFPTNMSCLDLASALYEQAQLWVNLCPIYVEKSARESFDAMIHILNNSTASIKQYLPYVK